MNIVLIGFMATGKTTVGRALSNINNMSFIDTDTLIEEKTTMSIKDIFQRYGELHFRKLENQVIKDLCNITNAVIATGGGAVLNTENFDNLRNVGKVVFLNTPLEQIFRNLESSFRPLIGNEIDKNKISYLYQSRIGIYMKADVIINVGEKNVDEIVNDLLNIIQQ